MFDKFKQLSELKKMRDQAMAMKRQLAGEKVEVEKGEVKVVVRGDQRIESITVAGEEKRDLVGILNQALDQVQKKAAQKMMMSGGLGEFLK